MLSSVRVALVLADRVRECLVDPAGLGIEGASATGDAAERAGIAIGSLYPYFPDRAAVVTTLAERYNAEGRACTAAELDAVRTPYARRPTCRRLWPRTTGGRGLQTEALLVMQLLATAVRVAITVADGDAVLDAFKRVVLAGLPARLLPPPWAITPT